MPTSDDSAEFIVSVAIRLGDLVISMPPPARHPDVILKAREHIGCEIGCKPSDQGFLLSNGKFVSRTRAMKIARESGQLNSRMAMTKHAPKELFSEDLW